MDKPLSLSEQISVCQQVSRLVRARLPIAGELSKSAASASTARGTSTNAAQAVDDKVSSGQSLAEAIAQDDSPDSRILAACIQSGEQSGTLDVVLKGWTAMHIDNAASRRSFLVAMLYPILLVVIAVLALGFLVWHLVPEYVATFLMFENQLPWWLEAVQWVRSQTAWLILLMLAIALAGPVFLCLSGRGRSANGIPRDKSAAIRQQALGCDLAALLLNKQMPLEQVTRYSALACGASQQSAEAALELTRQQETAEPMPIELCAVLSSVHAGAITPDAASRTLHEVADHLRDSAQARATRRARWLPMLVALSVGFVTLVTYTLIVYVPWLWVMQKIGEPENAPFTIN
ncbi:MAG: hypothetical protein Aurels2KO_41120 [Aureliella sp.]